MYLISQAHRKSGSEQGLRVVEDKSESLFKFSISSRTNIAQENSARQPAYSNICKRIFIQL